MDSLSLRVMGKVDIPKGTMCYVRYDNPYHVIRCKGMLETNDGKSYLIDSK